MGWRTFPTERLSFHKTVTCRGYSMRNDLGMPPMSSTVLPKTPPAYDTSGQMF